MQAQRPLAVFCPFAILRAECTGETAVNVHAADRLPDALYRIRVDLMCWHDEGSCLTTPQNVF